MECVVPAEGCLDVRVVDKMSVVGGNWMRFEEALPSAESLGEEQDMYTVSFLPSFTNDVYADWEYSAVQGLCLSYNCERDTHRMW